MLVSPFAGGAALPDLSGLSATACLRFVGQLVRVTGRILPNNGYGAFLDTGKVRIHLMTPRREPLDQSFEDREVVVVQGTLHRLALPPTVPGSSTPLQPSFYFVSDYTIHRSSAWPRQRSKQAIQPTAGPMRCNTVDLTAGLHSEGRSYSR